MGNFDCSRRGIKRNIKSETSNINDFFWLKRVLKVVGDSFTHQENRFLRSCIYEKAEKLERNEHLVTFWLVFGHSGLAENEKAD